MNSCNVLSIFVSNNITKCVNPNFYFFWRLAVPDFLEPLNLTSFFFVYVVIAFTIHKRVIQILLSMSF